MTGTADSKRDLPEPAADDAGVPFGPPHSALRLSPADRFGGYSAPSVALHWLSALAVAALVAALAAGRTDIHALAGIAAAPVLLVHAIRRLARGFPRPPDEPALASFLARLAIFAMLLATVALSLSGLVLAAATGTPAVPPLAVPIPVWLATGIVPDMAAWLHRAAVPALAAGFAVHLLAAIVHGALRRHAVAARIVRPVRGGR